MQSFAQRLQFGRSAEERVARVLQHRYGCHVVPAYDYSSGDKAPKLQGAFRGYVVPDLDVGVRPLAGTHTIDEVLHVRQMVVAIAYVLPRQGSGTELPHIFVDSIGFGVDLPAAAVDHQDALVAVELHAVLAGFRTAAHADG